MANDRRKFLGKLALGAGSLAALPLIGANSRKDEEEMEEHAVREVRALGFQWETKDPFLFCVHHEDKYPEGNEDMAPDPALLEGRQIGQDFLLKDGWRMYHGNTVPGFPGHPHRGFETITVVREGMVDHADSLGAAGRYGNGDVQWMTAGKGIQHSEMFPLINEDKPNHMELFQIWLNLPSKSKMVEPHFKMLWSEDIPTIEDEDEMYYIEVLVGTLSEKSAPDSPPNSWAAEDENRVGVYNIKLEPGAKFELPATDEGINRTLYYYKGNQLKVNDLEISNYHAAEVNPEADLVLQNGEEESKVLVLQGKPIGEPVVQHGPFVMNTKEEIRQTFVDYQNTQFGGWPWDRYDQVHDREKSRFALHSDGTEELKEG